jgi:hypothetical protein
MASKQTATEFLFDRWYSLVENYTSRKLTNSDDVFPALSGVVSEIIKLHADEYYAGLWRSKLHIALLWQAKGKDWSPLSRPSISRAPSWSWAAVNGPISYLSSSGIHHTEETFSDITIHEVRVDVPGQNSFGQVRQGVIRLTGSVKHALLDEGAQPELPGIEIQSPKGVLVGTGYLDADERHPQSVLVLKICKSSKDIAVGTFWFVLMLKRRPGETETYERVGMGKLTAFSWFDDAEQRMIVLL